MLDVKKQQWNDELCGMICSKELLPEIADSTYAVIGTVTAKQQKKRGLQEEQKSFVERRMREQKQ